MIKHGFVSAKADTGGATKLRPSNWGSTSTNYATDPVHVFDGGSLGALLYRDTGAIDGASWLADVAVGSVLVSGGVGEAPAWSASPTITFPAGAAATPGVIVGAAGYGLFADVGSEFLGLSANGVSILAIDSAAGAIRPLIDDARNIGRSDARWKNLYLSASVVNDGYYEGAEIADPAAPASNKGRLYFRDNGSGKTELVVRFPTGAIQIIKTEP